MSISVFDIFTLGIGPSSSHTVGPMRAARRFMNSVSQRLPAAEVAGISVKLYGSLAATGKGHGTDRALVLGLLGFEPETISVEEIEAVFAGEPSQFTLHLRGSELSERDLGFNAEEDIHFLKRESLPLHANGMTFIARDSQGQTLLARDYYSVGGGFILDKDQGVLEVAEDKPMPYAFESAARLMELCREHDIAVSEVMYRNEQVWREPAEIDAGLDTLVAAMEACIERGCKTVGKLPGRLNIERRAPGLLQRLQQRQASGLIDPLILMDWVDLYAIAVNEENAAGGKVVTAPTNGAAGVLPAVLRFYRQHCPGATDEGSRRFLLTAAAIALLFKKNASISGAEVGCQGEVGVACSMAAGALAEVLGGTAEQVENAAEIGMEHNLGLTCDPVGGLVQVPCIERNAMGAVKAINAARLALNGDGKHFVPLDKVIKTMRDTGADMKLKYKETSRGGLAVNVIEC